MRVILIFLISLDKNLLHINENTNFYMKFKFLSNYSMNMKGNSKGHGLYCSKQCALSSAVWYMGMMADVVEYY